MSLKISASEWSLAMFCMKGFVLEEAGSTIKPHIINESQQPRVLSLYDPGEQAKVLEYV